MEDISDLNWGVYQTYLSLLMEIIRSKMCRINCTTPKEKRVLGYWIIGFADDFVKDVVEMK